MLTFLEELEKNNITISLEGKDLKVNFENEIKEELIAKIKTHKEELISFLKKVNVRSSYKEIEALPQKEYYSISSAQRRLWTLSQFEGVSSSYNMPDTITLDGSYDAEVFIKAIESVVDRHEVLRTVFREVVIDGEIEVCQFILDREEIGFNIAYKDYRKEANALHLAQEYIIADSYKEFNLSEGPLLRVSLLQISETNYVLYYNMHHIITDGWSMNILSRDILAYYENYQSGKTFDLPELTIQYKDYSQWQLNQLLTEEYKTHKAYWRTKLSGDLPILDLPGMKLRPKLKTNNGGSLKGYFDNKDVKLIRDYVSKKEGTLFTFLITSLKTLFYRYTGQEDIIIGTPVAGRDHTSLEDQIGFYVNTLVLRDTIKGDESFDTNYARINANLVENYKHQMYPFDNIVEDLGLKINTSRSAIFDIIVVLQNAGETHNDVKISNEKGLIVEDLGEIKNKFDIEFVFYEFGESLGLNINYNKDLYDKKMIEQMFYHFHNIVLQLIHKNESSILSIDYLTVAEKEELINNFNATTSTYPSKQTIAELFTLQVVKTPDNTAIIFEGKQLTYKELDDISSQLSNYLIEHHVIKVEDFIGIDLQRSEWSIISILAILKSGGAYVPIDANYPQERIDYIKSDTNCSVIIDEDFLKEFEKNRSAYATTKPKVSVMPFNLAYVMYTSGSTGIPKGVLVEQRNVIRLVKETNYYNFRVEDILLSTGAFSFDATTFEYWGTLLNGGSLVLCPQNTLLDTELLSKTIRENHVNVMWFTAGWLSQLVDTKISLFSSLTTILAGGDKLSPLHISKLKETYPELKIINGYGPTENTTFSLTYEIGKVQGDIPIGYPINNSTAYILDENRSLVPKGVIGEIYLGGEGLSRGYLNDEALTSIKFIANPFQQRSRLYATGDLGRLMSDGAIEFMGRKDDQVKIRGHRIELGEIETTLNNIKEIEHAVVSYLEEYGLVAYYKSNEDILLDDIRNHLTKILPSYMIPTYYIQLEEIPLTKNGKVDRKSLPLPDTSIQNNATIYVAPRDILETKIVAIWEDVLKKENISITDDFFELGGHSLKMMRLVNAYHKEFNVKLKLEKLFANNILQTHAVLIREADNRLDLSIPKVEERKSYPISDAQRRLWIASQFKGVSAAYNISGDFQLAGNYDITIFTKAIESVIDRHETLRTVFREVEGNVHQFILDRTTLGFEIDYQDFKNEDNPIAIASAYINDDSSREFNLSEGPLVRISLLKISEENHILYFNMHHIISDGWSMNVLSKDILSYYEHYNDGSALNLLELRIQYKDYSLWQLAQLETDEYGNHKEYWENKLSGELTLLSLPGMKSRPRVMTNSGKNLRTYITKDKVKSINDYVKVNGGTLFTFLIASVKILLYKYTGEEDIIIGSPTAGREHAELENQIGFYVNTLTLRDQVNGKENFDWNYTQIKNNLLESYEHQVYPFNRLVEDLNLERDISRGTIFDVFVHLNNTTEFNFTEEIERTDKLFVKDLGDVISLFDIEFAFQEVGEYLSLDIIYNPDLYDGEIIERIFYHYDNIIKFALKNNDISISDFDYLLDVEREKLLNEFNNAEITQVNNKTVIDLFEEQAITRPNDIAIVFEKNELTYKELDEKSNQLVHYLAKENGLKQGELVGIKLERNEWAIVSILAVLKSGAVYVPIDTNNPIERIDYILKDSSCSIVIDSVLINRFKDLNENFEKNKLENNIALNDLAYIIYTSGSIGKPKGVEISHASFIDYVSTFKSYFKVTSKDSILQQASLSFDTSIEEIFPILISGGMLVIHKDKTDFKALFNLCQEKRITILSTNPYVLQYLNENYKSYTLSLREVISGGDVLTMNQINNLYDIFNVYNTYGPTESTVCSTYYKVKGGEKNVPIGRPILNRQIYILDKESTQLTALGAVGEICITGKGLAKGYLNNEELTQEKFIKNPFVKNGRLYRTGDCGKWLADGNLVFVGRIDNQIKIRGHRIELGEIENTLLSFEGIKNAAVIATDNAVSHEKELWAYITSDYEISRSDIQNHLLLSLPNYMSPSKIFRLEELPLTSNGKVDKKELLRVENAELASGEAYIAPRGKIEDALASIWSELLHKDKGEIGIDDGFFNVGGNSLKIIALKTQIEKILHQDISVAILFQNTTIRQQAEFFDTTFSSNFEAKFEGSRPQDFNTTNENRDIAIIGMSIKTPGARTISEYWNLLEKGQEPSYRFTEEELLASGVSRSLINNKNYVRSGFYLKDRNFFDASFFGYMPSEAQLLDPQTRLLHEVVWSALEDSGYNPLNYRGLIGLYAGNKANLGWQAYNLLAENSGKIDGYTASYLQDKDFANSLIAYKLNLKGAVNTVNTACSTSLVAIHHAAKSLLSGENDLAVAGGVSLQIGRKEGYIYQEGMISSPDGHTRSFDVLASGTVESEGAGVVVLKKLDKAIADGDNILAILKGSAINNDGNRKVGYTAPSVDGQIEVIKKAQQFSQVDPRTISYIETHGTATKLGDVIEFEALRQVFGNTGDKYCGLGSVKSNIGHLDTAAGVAGLIKTVLCLQHQKLAPSLHFNTPNPELRYENSNLYINDTLSPWISSYDGPRRAGVSSFGIGGTNAHIILEEYSIQDEVLKTDKPQIFTLSAKTATALERSIVELQSFLQEKESVNLSNAAWTLQSGRTTFKHRMSFTASDRATAIERLEQGSYFRNQIHGDVKKKVVFMFSGQGSQYVNMGKDLYASQEVFRETLDECFSIAEQISGNRYKEILFSEDANLIHETQNTQPILFVFEYALAKQLMHYGIQPDMMIGHSIGEYVAACLSGVFSLEDAIKIVIKRGSMIQSLPSGSMIGVGLRPEIANKYTTEAISIATINSKERCTFSGTDEAIAALCEQLTEDGISYQSLQTSHAFHSSMMRPIEEEFTNFMETITIHTPKIPYISNVSGKSITIEDLNQKSYWSDHIRKTVRFEEGLENIVSQDHVVLIEVGPGSTLYNFARSYARQSETIRACNVVRHPKEEENDTSYFLNGIGKLWTFGVPIPWNEFHGNTPRHKISMPTYAFEPVVYSVAENLNELLSQDIFSREIRKNSEISQWFYQPTWKRDNRVTICEQVNKEDWYIVFLNDNSFSRLLINELAKTTTNIITVYAGNEFVKVSDTSYEIDLGNSADYQRIFDGLSSNTIHPKHIIQLLNINSVRQENDRLEKQQGFYSLLYIAKALTGIKERVNVSVVTQELHKVFGNEDSPALVSLIEGILPVISQENPELQTRNIDVRVSEANTDTVLQLVREIQDVTPDRFVAHRLENRWVKVYDRIDVSNNIPVTSSKIKNKGVYLITGALGELGFVLAEYLLEKYDASLILTGRTFVSEKDQDLTKYNRLQLLLEKGNVAYFKANASDKSGMLTALSQGTAIFGEIQGIFHTAGVITGPSIRRGIHLLKEEESEIQFEAKVKGVEVLMDLFKDQPLDFCVFTSSLATVIGGKEFAAYAAANAYMDYVANAQCIKNSISINFDGLSFNGETEELVLDPSELIEVIEHSLSRLSASQLVISVGDLEKRIQRWVAPATAKKEIMEKELLKVTTHTIDRSSLSTPFARPETETENKLYNLFEEFFEIKGIGIDDDFFEMGGDSLKAMTISNSIHKIFNVELNLKDFFMNSTIRNLSKEIDFNIQIKDNKEVVASTKFEDII
ncbi:non-ribosomal peptide synthetase/type I polyketide synthase [Flavobacterium sp. '19STA2R22 D10 B1']|uniref:non-ribosomal peptide synthetase/type I polyketide synthase n=1 Tax=Flavobacterium aerium TaxID=3037261 RepID=UPI00278C4FCA|nr:non-ribosomal peptide synthetase/type I polyketide synthase [Flavobacterium sp. '19STA2R22 D10 B1']